MGQAGAGQHQMRRIGMVDGGNHPALGKCRRKVDRRSGRQPRYGRVKALAIGDGALRQIVGRGYAAHQLRRAAVIDRRHAPFAIMGELNQS